MRRFPLIVFSETLFEICGHSHVAFSLCRKALNKIHVIHLFRAITVPILRSASARSRMKTTRLEAFSDGVLAIIITIMVLELKVPHAVELFALKPVLPVLLSYILSFIYLGIYWNNHHHLFQATEEVSGG